MTGRNQPPRSGFEKQELKKMMLSAETQCAVQILSESLELTATILCSNLLCSLFLHRVSTIHLKIKGVPCFLSEKLSQDLLEKFFGCQRQKGRPMRILRLVNF